MAVVTSEHSPAGERRCLIVSPHFPPSTLAGVHRARHLAKHLPSHGWQPTVICVDPRQHVEPLDPALARLVPLELRLVATGAIPARLTKAFGVAGDIGLRAFFHLRAAIAKEMERSPADVVLITGSPYYPMLMAGWIRRRWGVPVVLDFQDPWVSNIGAAAPLNSKAGISHRLAVALEPRSVGAASFITSVSDRQNAEMARRYPLLDRTTMAGIPIGGDPDDFEALRKAAPKTSGAARPFVLSYVGTALPRATPLLQALFRGVAALRAREPGLSSILHLQFIGTSNQPGAAETYRVLPLAEAAGVADLVTEMPARIPYLEALGVLANTDAILMIGSDEPHYTASKIYPALIAGRPFLSIFHAESSAHDILRRAGGGLALGFETPAELEGLVPTIAQGLERLVRTPGFYGSIDFTAYASYTAHAIAGRFAQIFEEVAR